MSWTKNLKKKVAEASARTVAASANTKETVSIQKKQMLITNRKKAFGVEYLDLLDAGATPEELEACLERAQQEIAVLQEKMAKYAGRIETNREKLDRKLQPTGQPSISVTDAVNARNAAEENASAAFAPAQQSNLFDGVDDILEEKKKPTPAAASTSVSATKETSPFDEEEEDLEERKLREFEEQKTRAPTVAIIPPATADTKTNPFDDEEDEKKLPPTVTAATNPFEEEDEGVETAAASSAANASATNPFDDDDEEEAPPAAAAAAAAAAIAPRSSRSMSINPFDDDEEPEVVPVVEARAVPPGAVTPGVVVTPEGVGGKDTNCK